MTSYWIKLALSAFALGAVLWWADAAAVWARLQAVDPMWVVVAVAAITVATLAMAHRWTCVARSFGLQINYPTAVREYYLGQLINSLLPGGVAGDMARAVRARHGADLKSAAQSVVAERVLGQTAMFLLMFAGFACALVLPGGVTWNGIDGAVLGAVAVAGLVAWLLSRRSDASGRFVRRTAGLLRSPVLVLHGAITTICLIAAFYACARATNVSIPPEGWATLIPLTLCAMLIPLSVGGWGWREGAAAALFPLVGHPASAGIATGITYGLVLLVAVTPALALLLTPQTLRSLSIKGR